MHISTQRTEARPVKIMKVDTMKVVFCLLVMFLVSGVARAQSNTEYPVTKPAYSPAKELQVLKDRHQRDLKKVRADHEAAVKKLMEEKQQLDAKLADYRQDFRRLDRRRPAIL